jgi:hypothetical protein
MTRVTDGATMKMKSMKMTTMMRHPKNPMRPNFHLARTIHQLFLMRHLKFKGLLTT